jgi:hypothetical protein
MYLNKDMSNTRYIELNSTFRDRNIWPEPGEFEVLISQTGRRNTAQSALDPVCLSTPVFAWSGQDFDTTGHTGLLSGTINLTAAAAFPAIGDFQTFVLNVAAGQTAQSLKDYYINAVLRDTTTGEFRRILNSFVIGTTGGVQQVQVTVASAFGTLTNGDAFQIFDPTDLTFSANTNPQFFLPNGPLGENSYYHYYLFNETRSEYRRIIDYDATTGILMVETSTSPVDVVYGGPVTTWAASDNYSIRQEIPTIFPIAASTLNTVTLVGGSTVSGTYVGNFLRVISDAANTNKYDYYTYTAPFTQIRRIIAYDGATQIATVSPAFTAAPNPATMRVEMLNFSYDNMNPMVYTGSMVSQGESVCYEIEMIDLVLPNAPLATATGGQVAFYPYVYVELSNVSSPSGGTVNSIYSNNPAATKMMFRSAINDISNPVTSAFIKLDSDGMKQTLKFKVNDNLKFSVRLPNGQTYDTQLIETYSPSQPNPFSQVSARFAIRRL